MLDMSHTPQYLLGSQLMALKHVDGVRCNVIPIMNNVYTRMQEPQNPLFRPALAACFSFAVGSPEAWLKLGSLRHTCGLDVQFAKNIHSLFLNYKVHQHTPVRALC